MLEALPMGGNPWLNAIGLNTGLIAIAFLLPKKLLTPAGYLHAWGLGVLLWGTLGWQAYLVTLAYFAIGSAVTKVKLAEKEAAGIAEARAGVRGPGNVWGSALAGSICAIAVGLLRLSDSPASSLWIPLLTLGFVASFSTKLSDTCATEIGKAYGKRTFLITTLTPVPPGTEGAVSLEGTLAGGIGSAILATLAWAIGLISPSGIAICIVSAVVATTAESLIGATIEDQFDWLTHDLVNMVNTLIGAAIAIGLGFLWLY